MPCRARSPLVAERLLGVVLLACVFLGVAAASPATGADRAPVIAAAASLQFALEEIAAAFHLETGDEIRLSLGSSGNLARQIRQGAPYQVFLSADEQFVLELERDGFTEGEGALYSVGRLVLFVPHGSPLKADGSLEDLRAALADGRLKRFAIANPEHAPYGQRAEEALRSAGLWEAIRDRLVYGESVSQAAQFAASGNAQAGIIAESLARSSKVSALGTFALIPESAYRPLRQRMALVRGAGPVAARFYQFLRQAAARQIFARYGFALPDESG